MCILHHDGLDKNGTYLLSSLELGLALKGLVAHLTPLAQLLGGVEVRERLVPCRLPNLPLRHAALATTRCLGAAVSPHAPVHEVLVQAPHREALPHHLLHLDPALCLERDPLHAQVAQQHLILLALLLAQIHLASPGRCFDRSGRLPRLFAVFLFVLITIALLVLESLQPPPLLARHLVLVRLHVVQGVVVSHGQGSGSLLGSALAGSGGLAYQRLLLLQRGLRLALLL
mmetsp:Transcript_21014/g.46680  ORF Transcript_21014/g.46680 Transcript_21014/m.46680 type:complete len:229 (-) Transcript_21014:2069-2755(-)